MSRHFFIVITLLLPVATYAKGYECKHEASGVSAEITFLRFHKEKDVGVDALLGDFEVRNLSETLIVIPVWKTHEHSLVVFPDAILQYSNSDKQWHDAFYSPGIFLNSKQMVQISPGSSISVSANLQPLVDAERLLGKLRLVLHFRTPNKCIESVSFKIDS